MNQAEHLDLPSLLESFGRLVPPGHVNSAAGSPGGEDVQKNLPTAKVRDRERATAFERRQSQIGESIADIEPSCFDARAQE